MLTRLTHAAIAFAITAVAYQVYVLAVVPFVEPTHVDDTPEIVATEQQRTEARQVLHRHRDLFAAYFPPDHWTITKPPKTFETGKAMIALDDYHPKDNGELRVTRCVVLFFPTERVRGKPAPRDAIVLEAPHGAVLQMDEEFSLGLGGMGKFQSGKLLGDITVHSDMHEPGPQDDLVLKTRDLYMDTDMIRTNELVEMRLGPHYGRGRHLEIRLVAAERAKSGAKGPTIGGIDTLKIMRDVEAQFVPSEGQLPSGVASATALNAPVMVTSAGPFVFDFTHQVASFVEDVKLVQAHGNGPPDQLLCNQLNIFFAGEQDTVAPTADRTVNINAMGARSPGPGKLRPALLEAIGSDELPVRIDAPSQQAVARCLSMRIELGPRRITFNSNNEVVLSYQGNEVRAPMLQYQAPPENSPQRVGTLLAAGRGQIVGKADSKSNQDPFEARWTEKMQLFRENGKPVLLLEGRPRLNMVGLGQLWANYLRVYLRERAADGSEDKLLPGDIVPERMVASGSVEIDSAEMHGKVNKMDIQVEYASNDLVLPKPNENSPQDNRTLLGRRQGKHSRVYNISGDELQMLLTVRGRQPEVTSIDVNGKVVLRESTLGKADSKPLVVQGDHVRVLNADSPSAQISLVGAPATITAGGMSIHAQQLNVNRGTSRAEIDAPGELRMPIKQDLGGQQLPGPQYLMVRWQGGMVLERDVITFQGHVVANNNQGSLQTEELVLRLTAPIQFDGAVQQREVELAQIECHNGVKAEFNQRDQQGLTSLQTMELESFIANQRTGELQGTGPGWLESVHLADVANNFGALGQAQAVAPGSTGQRLRFLRVEFERGVRGNMLQGRRKIELFGDTKAVYGPVAAWEQRLEISIRNDPGPGTILVSSDKLTVAESPNHRINRDLKFGPMELAAVGNVIIDGSMGEHGLFNARAHKARYNQQKTLFVLEGDGQRDAVLTRQEFVGAMPQETSMQVLYYDVSSTRVWGDGFRGGKFNQVDIGRQPANPVQPRTR